MDQRNKDLVRAPVETVNARDDLEALLRREAETFPEASEEIDALIAVAQSVG